MHALKYGHKIVHLRFTFSLFVRFLILSISQPQRTITISCVVFGENVHLARLDAKQCSHELVREGQWQWLFSEENDLSSNPPLLYFNSYVFVCWFFFFLLRTNAIKSYARNNNDSFHRDEVHANVTCVGLSWSSLQPFFPFLHLSNIVFGGTIWTKTQKTQQKKCEQGVARAKYKTQLMQSSSVANQVEIHGKCENILCFTTHAYKRAACTYIFWIGCASSNMSQENAMRENGGENANTGNW